MSTGTLMLAWLLAAGPAPGDVYYLNQHQVRIPISIDPARRAEIKELILFMSADEGKTWNQQGVVSPDQDAFPFFAPKDGMYWFSVCVINQQNKREPPDPLAVPPSQKIFIDTLKPVVRIKAAERQGEEVVVYWEIQEEHPDWSTLKLEYRPADAPPNSWISVPVNPGNIGQARIRLPQPGPVALHLQVQDLAGNAGSTEYEMPAGSPGSMPAANVLAASSGSQFASAGTAPAPGTPTLTAASALAPAQAPVGPATAWEPQRGATPAPVARGDARPSLESVPPFPPVSNLQPVPPPVENTRQVAASTDKTAMAAPAFSGGNPFQASGVLPPLQMVNNKQVSFDYEVVHAGPSGIGKVELWMTPDDGKTWDKFTESTNINPPLTVDLPGEGVYGFRLVVQSKAGYHKPAPVPGELPEMRLELDLTPPMAKLFAPEPDPKQADTLMLTWTATDRNLAAKPITLEWAEQPDKEWQKIVADWPNEGHYTWKLPRNIPYLVYLRLTVRDTAGNINIAQTGKPINIDLSQPEGHLRGIVGGNRPSVGSEPPHPLDRPNELKGTDLSLNPEHAK